MRIQNILNSARLTLADKDKQRFSDEDLIVFLNQALQDFCQRTKFLNEQITVEVAKDENIITLPATIILLTRVTWQGRILPFYTYSELDSFQNIAEMGDFFTYNNNINSHSGDWELKKGRPRAIIWDKRKNSVAKIFPIPENALFLENVSSSFGVVTDSKINSNPFGVLSYKFGVTSSILKKLELEIYYVKTHENISNIDDILETDPMHDIALQHFICCQAFLTNLDNQYTEKAKLQRELYEIYVKRVMIEVSRYWSRAKQFRSSYRRGV